MIFSTFSKIFNKKVLQTYTFYIPAPPDRKSGYKEKEFDQVFKKLVNSGFKIVDIRTESVSRESSAGMWVILIIQAQTKKAQKVDLEDLFENSSIKRDDSIIHE